MYGEKLSEVLENARKKCEEKASKFTEYKEYILVSGKGPCGALIFYSLVMTPNPVPSLPFAYFVQEFSPMRGHPTRKVISSAELASLLNEKEVKQVRMKLHEILREVSKL